MNYSPFVWVGLRTALWEQPADPVDVPPVAPEWNAFENMFASFNKAVASLATTESRRQANRLLVGTSLQRETVTSEMTPEFSALADSMFAGFVHRLNGLTSETWKLFNTQSAVVQEYKSGPLQAGVVRVTGVVYIHNTQTLASRGMRLALVSPRNSPVTEAVVETAEILGAQSSSEVKSPAPFSLLDTPPSDTLPGVLLPPDETQKILARYQIDPVTKISPASAEAAKPMCFGALVGAAQVSDPTVCMELGGRWDTPVTADNDCPLFKANTNYPNSRGGVRGAFACADLVVTRKLADGSSVIVQTPPEDCKRWTYGGTCDLPLNMQPVGYRFASEAPEHKPLCYNCHDGLFGPGSWGYCCEDQKNRTLYPNLTSPDYAFPGDEAARKEHTAAFTARGLNWQRQTPVLPNPPSPRSD